MDRRDFLRWTSWAGVTCLLPSALGTRRAQAQSSPDGTYTGPFWIFMHAAGGWDPTHLCDPKGRTSSNQNNPVGNFPAGEIRTAGNFQYAPLGEEGTALDAFFRENQQRLLVLNGVDTGTNGHDQGTRGTWSGRTAEGHPALGALVAATYGRELPMPLIGYGGYLETRGVANAVPLGDASLLHSLAFPARPDPVGSSDNYFGHEGVPALIHQHQEASLARLRARTHLPRTQRAQSELHIARMGQDNIRRVSEALPREFSPEPLERQIQVALAAYQAGLAVGVSVSMGGFDTHGNHDANHLPRLIEFVNGATFAMQEAERRNVADRVVLIMGSDFGRTPRYNSGAGKDHWPVTSMMMMGPGIPGNRVIGATDEGHNLLLIDPLTLEATGRPKEAEGVRLDVGSVHRALRKLAGVSEEHQAAFPLGGADLPLFTPLV